jgi:hypothetical protein
VTGRRRALPHSPLGFVNLETALLEMVDHPLGELLSGIIGQCSLSNRRRRSRLQLTAKPIEKVNWSRKERWSRGMFWYVPTVIAWAGRAVKGVAACSVSLKGRPQRHCDDDHR